MSRKIAANGRVGSTLNEGNRDQFSDAHFRERRVAGDIEALRYLLAPDWLVQVIPIQKSIVDRARRLSPIAAWRVLVPFVIVFSLCYALASILDTKAESKGETAQG